MPCYNAHVSYSDDRIGSGARLMAELPTDTSLVAEQVQIALLCQAGLIRRVDLAAEMTQFAIDGVWGALRRRYPDASEIDIRVLFVEQQYGPTLGVHIRLALTAQAGVQALIPGYTNTSANCSPEKMPR